MWKQLGDIPLWSHFKIIGCEEDLEVVSFQERPTTGTHETTMSEFVIAKNQRNGKQYELPADMMVCRIEK